ncbi:unnamed protein product [Caenorhabditis auriculariae]|uniref:URB1 C-terminal domain-containing protein n=1 Tax=Caenorhabditis auriculariae TaxID=2777116 RepID=A0A8S1HS23_9PELO|nr:unnamed protein product [Caenorhabditis auriculariae]
MKRKWDEAEDPSSAGPSAVNPKLKRIFDSIRAPEWILNTEELSELLLLLKDAKDNSENGSISSLADFQVISNLLVSYNATNGPEDKIVFSVLKQLEKFGTDLSIYHPLVFGRNSRENYESLRKMGSSLHVRVPENEVLTNFLDQSKLWATAKHHAKSSSVDDDHFYDVEFVLCLLISILQPGSSLSCKLFVESNGLSFLFSCTSSANPNIRPLAYCALQRYLNLVQELKLELFPERSLIVYLIRTFKHGLDKESQRVSNIISHFFARVSKLILSPHEVVYHQVMAFLCMKPIFDVNNVPEFFKLFFSSSPEHCHEERDWVLTLIAEAMIEPMDYNVLQNKAGVKLMMCMFGSCCCDQKERKQILSILKSCASMRTVAHDLFAREALHSWIVVVINNKNLTRWEKCYLAQIFCILVENERKYQRGKRGKKVFGQVGKASVVMCVQPMIDSLKDIVSNEAFGAEKKKAEESIQLLERIPTQKWSKKKKYEAL